MPRLAGTQALSTTREWTARHLALLDSASDFVLAAWHHLQLVDHLRAISTTLNDTVPMDNID